MKVLGIIENNISAGGGYFQGLNAILQMKDICDKNNIQFEVVTISKSGVSFLKEKNINASLYKLSILDKLLHRILRLSGIRFLLDYLKIKWVYPVERNFKSIKPDLLYFIQPSSIPMYIKNMNFIYTIWDLCHRDFPEFPEVRNNNVFHNREFKYKHILSFASLVIIDSNITALKISKFYGVSCERLLEMPFSPNPFLKKISGKNLKIGLKNLNIHGEYLFYPAQFWPHKNHIGVLNAIMLLNEMDVKLNVIFVGGDKGNKNLIIKFINKYNLTNQVKILGFVSSEELNILYSGCSSVIMPTFFGPTNLPPLEAWHYNKPLIYSSLYPQQVENAAILVNPYDAKDIANGILKSRNDLVKKDLIEEGEKRIVYFEQLRNNAEKKIKDYLINFKIIKENWED